MKHMNPGISIVVLNWNAKEMTAECVASIKKQNFKDYELIVVDNGSNGNDAQYLKKKFNDVKIVQSEKNLGYAGGNNLGIKSAKRDWILILNNDIALDKNFLKELWNNRNKADILGAKNYYYDQKDIIWAIGSKVNKWTMKANLVGNKVRDNGQLDEVEVSQIVGSAMFVKKEVFEKIGGLDESYFCYYEETEWQTRATAAGFKISWVPSAKLWHKVAYSSGGGRSAFSAYYLVRNRARYIKKWSKHKLTAWMFWYAEIIARVIYGALKNFEYSKRTIAGAQDFLKNSNQ